MYREFLADEPVRWCVFLGCSHKVRFDLWLEFLGILRRIVVCVLLSYIG